MTNGPTLFGLKNTNRDFNNHSDWGKNIFNNAFPTSLACYMHSKGIQPVYLFLNEKLKVEHGKLDVKELFGHDPLDDSLFFAFESLYVPYEQLVASSLPRIDLVTCLTSKQGIIDKCIKGVEIKLTAVPDNSTAEQEEDNYGPEIVIRPDTIVYLALSIATNYISNRKRLVELVGNIDEQISDWNSPSQISKKLDMFCTVINNVLSDSLDMQKPLVLQPIWKTNGKSLELDENCLDTFVWSDYGFTRLFIDNLQRNHSDDKVTRPMRTCVWLIKMLIEFAKEGKFNHSAIIRNINFGSQTDKAFAVSGRITRNYLHSPELLKPRIRKEELRNIILNGGHKMLSPERRFDAAILSNASLFE